MIEPDDPASDDVQRLLAAHLAFAGDHSPPEDVHALDVPALRREEVSFFSVRDHGQLLGVGALKEIEPGHVEIKSMHTTEQARGTGVGKEMLDHLLHTARRRGYSRVSLETGTMAAFEPARRLYERAGFTVCPPYAEYTDSPYSVCMTLEL